MLALIGLAFLLFLAGLEVEFDMLRGRVLRLAGGGFLMSFALAVAAGLVLKAAGFVSQPLFAAIILSATSLGIIIPLLKDAGQSSSKFGQLVIAAGSIADFGAVILLSIFFSREGAGTASQLLLLGSFLLLAVVAGLVVAGAEHIRPVREVVGRLANTTAQIRVRGAFLLMIAFAALAQGLGLEVILGAFAAGAILKLTDRDQQMMHPEFRTKLEAVGYGVFIPVFFVTSGLRFDLDALVSSSSTLARVPVFLFALLLVRGVPALLYRADLGGRRTLVAALLQVPWPRAAAPGAGPPRRASGSSRRSASSPSRHAHACGMLSRGFPKHSGSPWRCAMFRVSTPLRPQVRWASPRRTCGCSCIAAERVCGARSRSTSSPAQRSRQPPSGGTGPRHTAAKRPPGQGTSLP